MGGTPWGRGRGAGLAVGAAPHYLAGMPLPRPAAPRVLWNDLRAFSRQRPRHQWVAAAGAVAIPIAILFAFYLDSRTNTVPRQIIHYVDSWPADRSDAEIKARQKADLERRRAAEQARQRQFQRIDDRLKQYGI